MIRCLILSRYGLLGASSRVRFGQHIESLRACGIETQLSPLLSDRYLVRRYGNDRRRYVEAMIGYVKRLADFRRAAEFDVVWVEGELFPGLPSGFEGLLADSGVPYVVDYDDAIFHRYDAWPGGPLRGLYTEKFRRLLVGSRIVTAGNGYLAELALDHGAPAVVRVPSVVDADRYRTRRRGLEIDAPLVVGWIGSPTTTNYLRLIEPALAELARSRRVLLRTIGAARLDAYAVPIDQQGWAFDSEVAQIDSIDVGIMPLADGPWERGKCGYKLVQYMAMSKPVVASPVGVNREIVSDGVNGFLADDKNDWVRALRALADSAEVRVAMGRAGRARVVERYSVQAVAPRIADVLRQAARK